MFIHYAKMIMIFTDQHKCSRLIVLQKTFPQLVGPIFSEAQLALLLTWDMQQKLIQVLQFSIN